MIDLLIECQKPIPVERLTAWRPVFYVMSPEERGRSVISVNKISHAKLDAWRRGMWSAEDPPAYQLALEALLDPDLVELDTEKARIWESDIPSPGKPKRLTTQRSYTCGLADQLLAAGEQPCEMTFQGVCTRGDPTCPLKLPPWQKLQPWNPGYWSAEEQAKRRYKGHQTRGRPKGKKTATDFGIPVVHPRRIDPATGLPVPATPPGVLATDPETPSKGPDWPEKAQSPSDGSQDAPQDKKSSTGESEAPEAELTFEEKQRIAIAEAKRMGIWEGD